MGSQLSLGSVITLTGQTEFNYSGALSVGDAVYFVNSANRTVARANPTTGAPPIGLVTSINTDTCLVAVNGQIASGFTGLTLGAVYWLTANGGRTTIKPASKAYSLGTAVSQTEILVDTISADLILTGGGTGDVTSVDASGSSGVTVTGGPITTTGTLTVNASSIPVNKGGTGLSSSAGVGAVITGLSSSSYVAQVAALSWRNRVQNGDMAINQRTVSATTDISYPVDRWRIRKTNASAVVTTTQSTTVPTGFTYSLLWTTNTGATSSAADIADVVHVIEGCNVYDLAWGTASAKDVTVSFWVRGSLTGTYSLFCGNATSDPNGIWYTTTYTISAANTWERKTITIPGPTTGTWQTGQVGAIALIFGLGSGSDYQTSTLNSWQTGSVAKRSASTQVNVVGTSGATFYLTGVQFEQGTVATPFELIQAGTNLQLCQRYYFRSYATTQPAAWAGGFYKSGGAVMCYFPPVTMRTTPSVGQNSTRMPVTNSSTLVTGVSAVYYGSCSMQIELTPQGTTGILYWYGDTNNVSYMEMSADI